MLSFTLSSRTDVPILSSLFVQCTVLWHVIGIISAFLLLTHKRPFLLLLLLLLRSCSFVPLVCAMPPHTGSPNEPIFCALVWADTRYRLVSMRHICSMISPHFVRMFPSLVNCCTIDWFTEWPRDALEKVATKFLEDLALDEETRGSCVQVIVTH